MSVGHAGPSLGMCLACRTVPHYSTRALCHLPFIIPPPPPFVTRHLPFVMSTPFVTSPLVILPLCHHSLCDLPITLWHLSTVIILFSLPVCHLPFVTILFVFPSVISPLSSQLCRLSFAVILLSSVYRLPFIVIPMSCPRCHLSFVVSPSRLFPNCYILVVTSSLSSPLVIVLVTSRLSPLQLCVPHPSFLFCHFIFTSPLFGRRTVVCVISV